MKRRQFLKRSAPLGAAPLVLGGMPLKSFASPAMLAMNCNLADQRSLVVIHLNGGNDGLNTLVPLAQHQQYMGLRPTIGMSTNSLINLDTSLTGNDAVGLHPGAASLKTMYDQDMVNIVRGVSYTNHNRSHFKSNDIYLTGGDGAGASNLNTGWMGRYLHARYPGVAGTSSGAYLDPLGIQIGDSTPSIGFYTQDPNQAALNLYGSNPSGFAYTMSTIGGLAPQQIPSTEFGAELQHIINVENSTNVYANRISQVYNSGANSSSANYPANSYFANQLKSIARMLSGGSTTKVFFATLWGFDTHDSQTDGTPTGGKHAALMAELFDSIKAFQDDLVAQQLDDKVMTVTFSEFGRTAVENGSYGTDHGTQAPMFIIGTGAKPGIIGTNPDLNALVENGTQLGAAQHDYRDVYAGLLQDWLGASDSIVGAAGFNTATRLGVVDPVSAIDVSCFGGTALPLRLQSFDAVAREGERVELEWVTMAEVDHSYTDVQRSADGRRFETILGNIPGKGLTVEDINHYADTDYNPLPGVSYYRLQHFDIDGRSTYSEVRTVELPNNVVDGQVKLYPNPAVFDANLALTLKSDLDDVKLSVVSIGGMIHQVRRINLREGFNKVNIDVSTLSEGQYFVTLDYGGQPVVSSQPLLVTRQ